MLSLRSPIQLIPYIGSHCTQALLSVVGLDVWNAVEFPYPLCVVGVVFGVLNVIENLGIRDKILVDFGIVDFETEHDMFRVLDDIIFILLDKGSDFGTILFTIGLWW